MADKVTLQELMHGDQGEYGYLFPFRKRVPTIKDHIFTNLKQSTRPLDHVVVDHMLNIDYIGWTAKVILGLDLFPIQIATLQTMWNTPFPMLIACRGGSKSFMLAVYSVLRALLDPGTKIVIVGAGLRQARLVFNYIDTIWNNSPVLRSIVGGGKKAGPRQSVDLCYFKIGDSIVYALPLGDGCVSGDTLTLYNDCFGTISDDQDFGQTEKTIVDRDREIWGNGKFRTSDESYCNGRTLTKKIVTSKGFEIEGTHNHKIKVLRDAKVRWIRFDEMVIGDRVLIDRSIRWHSGSTDVTIDEGYALGLLVGDGCFTYSDRLSFATADKELLSAMECIGKFVKVDRSAKSYEYYCYGGKKSKQQFMDKFGVNPVLSYNKTIPSTIMQSSREVMSGFIRGLFDSDGGVQIVRPNTTSIGGQIRLTNTSKKLLQQVQFILLHYGIISSIKKKKGNEKSRHQCYDLSICGKNIKLFADYIGFGLKRKQDILDQIINEKKAYKDRDDVVPGINGFMSNIAKEYKHGLVGKERLAFNTMMCRIRNGKQSRSQAIRFLEVFKNVDDERLTIIQNLVDDDIYYDDIMEICDDECVTFDVHVPDNHEYCAGGYYSHNTKIRGFRANVVIADEFASIPEDIFDVVVRGFAATAKTPVEEAKKIAFNKTLSDMDIPKDIKKKLLTDDGKMHGNQIVYSGTAYYAFNHFALKYQMWLDIISSKGDPDRVAQIFGGENLVPDEFNYKDYSVIRIPHTHLPAGLLDARQLAHAKATLPKNIYLMEYGAVFVKDSDGFYPRSLIEGCTVGPNRPIDTPDGQVTFTPLMRGQSGRKYVMGIDPAAEKDNLAVVIIEVWKNHYRIVHCWAVNKKEFIRRKKLGFITDDDYYAYCCSRIREIVRIFNPIRIEMDSQGGGYAVSEMLRNKKLLNIPDGDFPIYEVIDFDNPKDTDGETDGRHILHLVQQSSEYNQNANIALHKSLETRTLLFPAFDSVKMFSSLQAEKSEGIIVDTYEENVFNIEELKNELCTIQMSETTTGRERFDTPTVIQPGAVEGRTRKGRLKKDRYTALMLAHKFIYDTEVTPNYDIDYEDVAGNVEKRSKPGEDKALYRGPGVGRMRNSSGAREGNLFGALKRGEKFR